MWGLVDDYWGDRFGKFGTPVTLRIYFENSTLIPMEMFHLADWNFMSADEDGYLGYIYGSKEENTLWLSGLQSDFCQRYSWLFQKRGIREIRCGLQKKTLDNLSLIEKYKPFIPILRKAFQREWIIIFLLGICTWMNNTGAIRCAIHQFPLTPGESSKGTFMKRIYRGLPEKIKGEYISLSSGCGGLRYYVMDFDDILGYLRHLNKNFKF